MSLDLRSDGLAFVSGTVGLVAVAVLGGALILKRPGWIGPALALLALLYLGHVFATGTSDVGTLLSVSIALLVSGELGQWSLDSRLTGRREMAMHRARAVGLAWLSAAALGTVLVGALALGIQIPGGGWSALVAVAGAVALLGIIARIATSSADAPRTVADTGPSSE